MRHALLILPALSLAAALACTPETTVSEDTDAGILCFDDQFNLVVDFQTCLSSSCDTVTDATCTATLDTSGGTENYEVTTYLRIESETGECTDDCGFTTAPCADALIDDMGSPTVTFNGSTVDWGSIPSCSITPL